jgi:hypothetical protein
VKIAERTFDCEATLGDCIPMRAARNEKYVMASRRQARGTADSPAAIAAIRIRRLSCGPGRRRPLLG